MCIFYLVHRESLVLGSDNGRLDQRLRQVTLEKEGSIAQAQALEVRVTELDAKLADMSKTNSVLDAARSQLASENHDLMQAKLALEADRLRLIQDIESLTEQEQILLGECEQSERRIIELSGENQMLNFMRGSLEQALAVQPKDPEQETARLRVENRLLRAEIGRLSAGLEGLQEYHRE